MNRISIFLWVILAMLPCCKSFNLIVHNSLRELSKGKYTPSDSIRLTFRLYVDEIGKISHVQLLKQKNLNKLRISDSTIISAIKGETLPCLRNIYYKEFKKERLPDNIVIIYDSNSPLLSVPSYLQSEGR